jgi:general secretion pathway protein D
VEARLSRHLKHTLWFLLLIGALFTSPALASGKGVVLNFNEVDISTMVKFISDLTGRNFVLDDRVKGKISVYSPSKLSTEEAYNVFVSVLELKGFTVVQSGKVAKIIPSAAAKQSGFTLLPSGATPPVNEKYVAQVSKLENISAQEAQTFLQPMVSKDGHISAFGPGNLLLIVDSSLNLLKLQEILHAIDNDRIRGGLEIIYLQHAAAENVATTIRQWLSGSEVRTAAGQVPTGSAAGIAASVMADQRLNALLVFGNDAIKKSVREMVAKLDTAPPEASSKLNVYYLENTDATEMAKVLEGVVKGLTPVTPGQPAAAVSPFDSGKVTITPDRTTNSLVIMASVADYNNLAQVIKKLDRRSKQVFVQLLIAEVNLDNNRELGLQAGVIGGGVLNKYLAVAGVYDPQGAITSLLGGLSSSTTSNLLKNFNPSSVNVAGVLKLLDQNDMLNILSTPNLLTSDNKEAEISVGENVPFQGGSTQSSIGTTTSIERKDVGILLRIKPQISEGDYIRMDISQEISLVKKDKGQAVDLVTTKRGTKTNVVIKDKDTVVIGGLIQDTEEDIVIKTPFLGDIPGLGWLFKTTQKLRKKTNLIILITPQIVKDSADLRTITENQKIIYDTGARDAGPVDVRKGIAGAGAELKPVEAQKETPLK